ncbi:unnamed protein product [Calypogeia fissa]
MCRGGKGERDEICRACGVTLRNTPGGTAKTSEMPWTDNMSSMLGSQGRGGWPFLTLEKKSNLILDVEE